MNESPLTEACATLRKGEDAYEIRCSFFEYKRFEIEEKTKQILKGERNEQEFMFNFHFSFIPVSSDMLR